MNEIELKVTNLPWQEESDPFKDCCLHGGVYIRIGDIVLSDGENTDWTVSAAAFNLLKTLKDDHKAGDQRPLIPHCGQTMWVLKSEPESLYLGGCDIGIDWTIEHEPGIVVHKLYDKGSSVISDKVWRNTVCQFSVKCLNFS